jgi:hypothetical protein
VVETTICSNSWKSLPIAMASARSLCKASFGEEKVIEMAPGDTETPSGGLAIL